MAEERLAREKQADVLSGANSLDDSWLDEYGGDDEGGKSGGAGGGKGQGKKTKKKKGRGQRDKPKDGGKHCNSYTS